MTDVKINRLKRKILKLQNQRDHYKEQNTLLDKMIRMYPLIKSDYKKYEENRERIVRLKDLENRVKEQEFLIRLLLDNDMKSWELQHAYDEVIKREMRKLNRGS